MKHIGILPPDRWVSILNWIGIPVVALYFISMIIYPFVHSGLEWGYVQSVWDRWQSLNVGMLAFTSSIIAFNISRFNANKQREREFLAAKAFLPSALSELIDYFVLSSEVFVQGWGMARGQRLEVDTPELPESYKEIFQQCIRYADPEVGDYLTKILVNLQVHHSRIRGYIGTFNNDEANIGPDRHNLIVYIFRLGELQALVGKIFSYARNESDFDSSPLCWMDFRNAYGNLSIRIDEFRIDEVANLEDFTRRYIDREENT